MSLRSHKTFEIEVFSIFLLVDGRIRRRIRTNNYISGSWRPKNLLIRIRNTTSEQFFSRLSIHSTVSSTWRHHLMLYRHFRSKPEGWKRSWKASLPQQKQASGATGHNSAVRSAAKSTTDILLSGMFLHAVYY